MAKISDRYSHLQIALHWLMALMILGGLAMGLYLEDLPLSPLKLKLLSWHKWNGISVLLLFFLRLAVRHISGAPALPAAMPSWQQLAAVWGHRLLYLLMLLIPLSGWLMSSAKGFSVVYFGVLPLPDLVTKNADLADLFKEAHELLNQLLLLILAGHVGAALKHHYFERDDILTRMLPFLKSRNRSL